MHFIPSQLQALWSARWRSSIPPFKRVCGNTSTMYITVCTALIYDSCMKNHGLDPIWWYCMHNNLDPPQIDLLQIRVVKASWNLKDRKPCQWRGSGYSHLLNPMIPPCWNSCHVTRWSPTKLGVSRKGVLAGVKWYHHRVINPCSHRCFSAALQCTPFCGAEVVWYFLGAKAVGLGNLGAMLQR